MPFLFPFNYVETFSDYEYKLTPTLCYLQSCSWHMEAALKSSVLNCQLFFPGNIPGTEYINIFLQDMWLNHLAHSAYGIFYLISSECSNIWRAAVACTECTHLVEVLVNISWALSNLGTICVSCSQTLLHVPQRHLCPGRSIPLGQLVATQCCFCSCISLKEDVWNAVVNRCENRFELIP